MRRFLILSALGLMLCASVALAADDGGPSFDPTSIAGWLELALKVGVPTAGLGGVIFWLLRYHVPGLQETFKGALVEVVKDHKESRAEDRQFHLAQHLALKEGIAAEGEANRLHRESEGKRLRATLTGLSRKQLREAEADENEEEEEAARPRRTAS